MARKLDKPITEGDFQQLVLVANAIAVFQMAVSLEKQGTPRRAAYADVLMRIRRLESSIPGYTEERISDASTAFYDSINNATWRFMKSFKPFAPPVRDANGRFKRCRQEVQQ